MKIILVKNCGDPDHIEIVKTEDGSKNLVFESYINLDEWCYEHGLVDDDGYLPIIIDRVGLRLDKIMEIHNSKYPKSEEGIGNYDAE